ncbi:MAG: hypothetical protein N4J56_007976 [Chroococcidiopsis sp. SAG 2025]|uniref:hypothetical protein n=1 Tax=Chroococcidiopsis sp. SAG 2025 TaxID=171389 RepID=UPI002936FFC8|nr:hypothetical protein [Chroococcidiopsis sp. SAG 2025]MDV2998271.1 hypothetical protein [Chroococcidiopsis sp. SAG 2025]
MMELSTSNSLLDVTVTTQIYFLNTNTSIAESFKSLVHNITGVTTFGVVGLSAYLALMSFLKSEDRPYVGEVSIGAFFIGVNVLCQIWLDSGNQNINVEEEAVKTLFEDGIKLVLGSVSGLLCRSGILLLLIGLVMLVLDLKYGWNDVIERCAGQCNWLSKLG